MSRLKTLFKKASKGPFALAWIVLAAVSLCLFCVIGIWHVSVVYYSDEGKTDTTFSIAAQKPEESGDKDGAESGEDENSADEENGDESQDIDSSGNPNLINTAQIPDNSFIYDISIDELATADSYLDGQTVQVIGEVVGDRVISEENRKNCWITLQTLNDSDSEIPVYMTRRSSSVIDSYGSYSTKGTTLQVQGTFYLASKDHQGASEIHAESITVVSPGHKIEKNIGIEGLLAGLFLIFLGSFFLVMFNILRERRR